MKEKMSHSGKLTVKQDPWSDSPCSRCGGSICCSNLPLAPFELKGRRDFINLTLLSCYNGILPGLKKSGEWTLFLSRKCNFLDPSDGKCTIHKNPGQSMICKTYDAHNCWYIDAFSPDRFSTMIPFNTEMLVWFEKRYDLMNNRFSVTPDWEDLCSAAFDFRSNTPIPQTLSDTPDIFEPNLSYRLPFKKSRSDQHLFFPPFQRPSTIDHFELLTFRLSYPGIYLAISDSCWAYLVKTRLNPDALNMFRLEYFPGIEHKDGDFSFEGIWKEFRPYSEIGEQWVVLNRPQTDVLKNLVKFDSSGNVRRLPTSRELLEALRTRRPDKAA